LPLRLAAHTGPGGSRGASWTQRRRGFRNRGSGHSRIRRFGIGGFPIRWRGRLGRAFRALGALCCGLLSPIGLLSGFAAGTISGRIAGGRGGLFGGFV